MREDSVSFVGSVEDMLNKLSPLSSDCCIYRVPERLCQINEKVYKPQVVSIGPLHYGRAHLQSMQEHKKRYLKDFVQRTKRDLAWVVDFIKRREQNIRRCYAEEIELSSDEFVKMILLDAAFIIEVFLRNHFPQLRKDYDHIFHRPFLIEDIWSDMWLLENQLPFFILEDLFSLAEIDIQGLDGTTFTAITFKYFENLEALKGNFDKFPSRTEGEMEHFLDFLRICHLPSSRNKKRTEPDEKVEEHCLDLLGMCHLPSSRDQKRSAPEHKEECSLHCLAMCYLPSSRDQEEHTVVEAKTPPSVTDLHQAGVQFCLSESSELFDIEFKDGTLHIPKLKLQLETESVFRNLIAFEQRHYAENFINDYVFMIHHLVNSANDVELLVQSGIIENWLSDKEGASALINNLSRGTTLRPESFYFSDICERLNGHCKQPCNKWKANLKQNYFNSPWAFISFVAAVFLILLTVIQAVCSVLQVLSPPKNH